MAVKRGFEDISDESDFYGDDDTVKELRRKARLPLRRGYVLPVPLSAIKRPKLHHSSTATENARGNAKSGDGVLDFLKSRPQLEKLQKSHWQSLEPKKTQPARTLSGKESKDLVEVDFFKGHPAGWQQSKETVREFLDRLPVADPETAQHGPWLWVGSPRIPWEHLKRRKPEDLSAFGDGATKFIDAFNTQRAKLERDNPGKDAAVITRKMASFRDQLEIDLLTLAVKTSTTCGKWMLFPEREDLPRVWRTVATATSEGKLGHTSKVGTYDPADNQTLICVYTYDFSDAQDVRRVLDQLVELNLCSATGKPIYYKCDAYTHLGINSANPYRLRASLYSSKDFLQNEAKALKDGPVARLKKRNKTMDEFFHFAVDEDIT